MSGKYRQNRLLIAVEIVVYALILAGLVWYFLPQALQ